MILAQTGKIELIQESLTGQGEAKEPQEKNVNSQILQFTPDMIAGQVQGVLDADKDDAKHISTVPDVALANEGFDDWHNRHLIQSHENSEKHRNAMLAYLTKAANVYFQARGTNKSRTAVLVACHGENYCCNMHSCRTRLTIQRVRQGRPPRRAASHPTSLRGLGGSSLLNAPFASGAPFRRGGGAQLAREARVRKQRQTAEKRVRTRGGGGRGAGEAARALGGERHFPGEAGGCARNRIILRIQTEKKTETNNESQGQILYLRDSAA
ncbi:Hypothetical predicted protein [Podarcis lilfordi]|uniref:Uncharacterized protein n=1 Tax=Podarcis lilfordi TaxID=74358 RepID=A0AA35JUN3_9SAUR|nr:Hypothetical predicted protein [Podarcis lilfordi]